jgi:hypothetical protein
MDEDEENYDDVDWEDSNGKSISQIKTENNSCIGQEDIIYHDVITPNDEPIMMDNQCYKKNDLLNWIRKNRTVPHNRRPTNENEVNGLNYRGGKKSRKTRRKTIRRTRRRTRRRTKRR